MAKPSKKSRRDKASPPAVELAPRLAPRRASAERRMRILERLTCGHRVRQFIAGMLEKRELDPQAGFVQLQIARLSVAAARDAVGARRSGREIFLLARC